MITDNATSHRIHATETSLIGERLWGAPAIAKFCGVSVATVYRWADRDGCPITLTGGRYFALKSQIMRWMLKQ